MKIKTKHGGLFLILIVGLGFLLAGRVTAQTFTNLYAFTGGSDGAYPICLALSGNAIYGVAADGGSTGNGTVFAVNLNNSSLTPLHSFTALSGASATNSDGAYPGSLILAGNTLYGTADGGDYGNGTVFAINTNGGGFTNLYNFTAIGSYPNETNSDGSGPNDGLILAGDTLYGTTLSGGVNGNGTIFAVNTNGTQFRTLYSFTALDPDSGTNTDGAQPGVGLTLSGSTLYGTTWYGGNSGDGAIFAINTNGMFFTNLCSFNYYGNYPEAPPGLLVLSGNTIYGATEVGGTNGTGAIFSVNTDGSNFTNLYTFTAAGVDYPETNSDGISPGNLVLLGHMLYGSAVGGGTAGNGTLFAVNTDGTGFTNLYTFAATSGPLSTNSNGAGPVGNLVLSDNVLYGQAGSGGNEGAGTLFSFLPPPGPLEVLTTTAPNGTLGSDYTLQLSADFGKPPYHWSLVSGSLPPGINLATDGSISGTPTATGTFDFTVQVTDALSATATQALVLTLFGPPVISIQPTNTPVAVTVGGGVSYSVSVTGDGPFGYQWQLNGTNLPDDIITTVAGGYLGDGKPATNAALDDPQSVAVDTKGHLFIADSGNNAIRKVGTNGIIASVAGNGLTGYSGDGGEATNAELNSPTSVATDASGNLFVADARNNCIREVATNGVIITVAGNRTYGYSGDGGGATNAELNYPSCVAIDASGNLFIADTINNRIREVATNGIITTVAGDGFPGPISDGGAATNTALGFPSGVAVDASGNLFIADTMNNRIREVATNGIITTVAGGGFLVPFFADGGAATNAELIYPEGVAVDAADNLFIADIGNERIREVTTNGIITTVAGSQFFNYFTDEGAATNADLANPKGVAVDGFGNLFIADSDNNVIRKVVTNGIISTVVGGYIEGGNTASNAELDFAEGVAVDTKANLFIADTPENIIRKVGPNGLITTVAGNATPGYSGDGRTATNAQLSYPASVTVDASGNLFIADSDNNVIRKVDIYGIITTVVGNDTPGYGISGYSGDGGAATNAELSSPSGVAIDISGNLFIADTKNNAIRKVDTSGIITTVAGNGMPDYFGYSDYQGAATNAQLYYPEGVAVDTSGNLFIADSGNNVIRKVDTSGIITTVAGNGMPDDSGYSNYWDAATNAQLNYPEGVAVDSSGNLFIADSDNSVIREMDTSGIITTVAGNGTFGYFGDGGAATNAALTNPQGVAADASGNLFIADVDNERIRKVVNPGASVTGPILQLNNVNPVNAGEYDVIVSNPYGSVTSSVVNLTITIPAILSTPQITSDKTGFTFLLSGPAGSNYVLQVSTNLSSWSSVSTSTIPVSGTANVSNALSSGYKQVFYRVRLQ